MPKRHELSLKQRRFIAEYLKDGNGTQAAIRAGYAPKNARITASQQASSTASCLAPSASAGTQPQLTPAPADSPTSNRYRSGLGITARTRISSACV